MTYTEFARLIYDMRQAQKAFFNRRTRTALELAKDLERRVDREVLQILGDAITAEQPNLFNN